MPAPMWAVIGIVEQWYIQTPARVAVNRYTSVSPGWMVRIGRSGASAPAWKSIECPIDAEFTRVTSNTSPIRPCSVGPGARPLKVQRRCHTPGATSRATSFASSVRRCTFPDVSGGSTGSMTPPSAWSGGRHRAHVVAHGRASGWRTGPRPSR